MLDDPAVVKASQKFVRIIVRRPHAYEFRAKDKDVPIPGIIFLDSEGKSIGTAQLDAADKLAQQMNELRK